MTGHRSIEALCSYERVSTEQQKAVSRVLMRNTSFGSENHSEENELCQQNVQVVTLVVLLTTFGDLTNCTIGNITVNVNPKITFEGSKLEKEFDELVGSASLEY